MSKKSMNPMLLADFYKVSHREQYPEGTQTVYSTWTPRASRMDGVNDIVVFGFQAFIKEYLIDYFNDNFFNRPLEDVIAEYVRYIKFTLGKSDVPTRHIEELHELGYLPISILALPEGTVAPLRVPVLTIENTNLRFFWVTNFLETLMSCQLWQMSTSATIALQYKKILTKYAEETNGDLSGVPFQGHDFSMRGMGGVENAMISGAGHLLSFVGTDSIPAIWYLEQYYNCNIEKEMVGTSIPACYDNRTEVLTEHGWKYFAKLNADDKVAQYHNDGHIDFVIPSQYYNMQYCGKMIHYDSVGYHYVDCLVTPNHRMVRKSKASGLIEWFEADDKRYHFRTGYGSKNEIIISGIIGSGRKMTASEKLKIAFQADGSYPSHSEDYTGEKFNTYPIRFSLKKDRKKDRLIKLCKEAGVEYTISSYENGYYSFWIKPTERYVKTFDWINLSEISKEWADDFISELKHWDGHKGGSNTLTYTSTVKENVDIVHAICALSGRKGQYSSNLDQRLDNNRQVLHCITILENKTTVEGGNAIKKDAEYEGTIHCVSVPTKLLVVRRNNVVIVSGNTEHSVMCAYGKGNEFEAYKHLITDVYPSGFASIVSDTWNLWDVLNKIIKPLKNEIMARDGRIVIRPDSGDPVLIICGNPDGETEDERKGVIEILWDTFGGTTTEMGYKQLDSHVGCIYGDAITIQRCEEICKRLKAKGFASTNMVFGIGSYTYNYVTRDTFGYALKSTYAVVNGVERLLFKDPITDDGTKKSQRGLVRVYKDDEGKLYYLDDFTVSSWVWEEIFVEADLLETIFRDGKITKEYTLAEIRERLAEN